MNSIFVYSDRRSELRSLVRFTRVIFGAASAGVN